MSEVGELNLGSELNSNTSTSDEPLSAFKKALEVIVIRTIQNVIKLVLEPLIQSAVEEQNDLAQERIIASMNQPSGERPNSSSPRRLKLRFGNKLPDPVLTGKPISGEDGTALKIELVDENTNLIVKTGPQSSGRLEITVLRADTRRDEKEGNTSLLNGCTYLDLNEGIGLVGKISFPHRSKWTKKSKYMLITRFVDDFDGISVMEAKSEVFTLEDRRNKRCEKHKFPTLLDEVLCLDNIGKRGPYVKRLKNENIITVKNFLTEYFNNHQRLKEILKMPEKKLNKTIKHALSCKELEDKYIYYIPDSLPQMVIVLNVVGQLFGLISNCQFDPIETLSETQKEDAQKLVVSALEHWGDVVPYNEHSLFSGHSGLVFRDHIPSIFTGYDYMPPCISSPNNILFGTSHVNRYDHNPPITHSANGTLSDIFIRQSSNDTCHDNCEHGDVQPIAAPVDITPLNDTFSYPFEGTTSDGVYSGSPNLFNMEFGNESTRSQDDFLNHWIQDPGFSTDEYYGSDERLKKNISKSRFREWEKMISEKPSHVKKKPRFN